MLPAEFPRAYVTCPLFTSEAQLVEENFPVALWCINPSLKTHLWAMHKVIMLRRKAMLSIQA